MKTVDELYDEMLKKADEYGAAFLKSLYGNKYAAAEDVISAVNSILENGAVQTEEYPVALRLDMADEDGWTVSKYRLPYTAPSFLVSLRGENGPTMIREFEMLTPESLPFGKGDNRKDVKDPPPIPGYLKISMDPGFPDGVLVQDGPNVSALCDALETIREMSVIYEAANMMTRALQDRWPFKLDELEPGLRSGGLLYRDTRTRSAHFREVKTIDAAENLKQNIFEALRESSAMAPVPISPFSGWKKEAVGITIDEVTLLPEHVISDWGIFTERMGGTFRHKTDEAFWVLDSDKHSGNALAVMASSSVKDVFRADPNRALSLRPALKSRAFIEDEPDSVFYAGDRFVLAGKAWTVLGDGYALCNESLGNFVFRKKNMFRNMANTFGLMNASRYEGSDIEKSIRRWARSNGIVDISRETDITVLRIPDEYSPQDLEFVRKDGMRLEYVPKKRRSRTVCLAAVEQKGRALQFVPEHLRTWKLCLAAVEQRGWALQFVPEHLRTQRLCVTAVQNDGWALQYVPEDLKTPEMCLAAVRICSDALKYVPEEYRTLEICLTAVKQDGKALWYISDEQKTGELCMAAVQQNGWALNNVPEALKTPEICLAAVKQNGQVLRDMPEAMKTPEICLAAVKQYGLALMYVPWDMRAEELCLAAVQQNGRALECVPNYIRPHLQRPAGRGAIGDTNRINTSPKNPRPEPAAEQGMQVRESR